MRSTLILLMILGLCGALGAEDVASPGGSSSSTVSAIPPALATRVDAALALLNKQKYADFLDTFANPVELAASKKEAIYAQKLAEFGQRRAPALIIIMGYIKANPGLLSSDGSSFTTVLPESVSSMGSIRWVLVDGQWHLSNHYHPVGSALDPVQICALIPP